MKWRWNSSFEHEDEKEPLCSERPFPARHFRVIYPMLVSIIYALDLAAISGQQSFANRNLAGFISRQAARRDNRSSPGTKWLEW
jgi:hypothetical protein